MTNDNQPAENRIEKSNSTRRQFLKLIGTSSVALIAGETAGYAGTVTGVPADSPASVPESSISPAQQILGQYENRIVPDTVDLVHNANLAVNAMSRTCDPQKHFDTYFFANLAENPPRLVGPPFFFCKFYESLALIRLMTGSKAEPYVDDTWTARADYISRTVKGDTVDGGRLLETLALYYHITGDKKWLAYGNRIVDRWQNEVVVKHDDFAFFPHEFGDLVKKPDVTPEGVPTGFPATSAGWALQGLSVYYRETHYEPARDLAGRLARYIRYHAKLLDDDGRFLGAHDGYLGPKTAVHFHHNSNCALALTEYALATNEMQYAQFARKCYEYGRSVGNPVVGYFPEYIPNHFPDDRNVIDCEGCCVADMTALALKLTEANQGNYWEDIDHYVRNMLTEMQLKSSRWVYESVQKKPTTNVDATKEDAWMAVERLVGSFAGWSGPNQFQVWGPGIMHCCTGNCSRALYYVWNRMISQNSGQLNVELMLNRNCDTALIKSDLPYAGRLRILLKKDCQLRIRKPDWLDASTVNMFVLGDKNARSATKRSISFRMEDEFLKTDPLSSGSELHITFTLPEQKIKTRVGYIDANVTLRGNEVVAFDPPGGAGAYWQNKSISGVITPEVERTYFIPEHEVRW